MQDSFKQYGLCLMVMCALVLFCAVPAEAKGAVEDADFSAVLFDEDIQIGESRFSAFRTAFFGRFLQRAFDLM